MNASGETVAFCPGPSLSATWCGRYATLEAVQRQRGDKAWHVIPPADPYEFGGRTVYVCPTCFRARIKARVRAALVNGVRLDTAGLSPDEREAASQVLGADFLAAVDKGWDEDRKTTPPMGTPMGVARNGAVACAAQLPCFRQHAEAA